MRKLKAEQMAEMPAGTMFVYGGDEEKESSPFCSDILIFGGWMTRHGNTGSWDWTDACQVWSDDDHDNAELDMDKGRSADISHEPSFGRHGMFPKQPTFYIFEPKDLLALRGMAQRAIDAALNSASAHERLADALAEDTLAMSDSEIVAELVEDGIDPSQLDAEITALVEDAIRVGEGRRSDQEGLR